MTNYKTTDAYGKEWQHVYLDDGRIAHYKEYQLVSISKGEL